VKASHGKIFCCYKNKSTQQRQHRILFRLGTGVGAVGLARFTFDRVFVARRGIVLV
jgi:hypothetical protein